MTPIITQFIVKLMKPSPFDALMNNFSVITILILLLLLILKEFIRTFDRPQAKEWMQVLDIGIKPLLIVFGLIVLIRFLSL